MKLVECNIETEWGMGKPLRNPQLNIERQGFVYTIGKILVCCNLCSDVFEYKPGRKQPGRINIRDTQIGCYSKRAVCFVGRIDRFQVDTRSEFFPYIS